MHSIALQTTQNSTDLSDNVQQTNRVTDRQTDRQTGCVGPECVQYVSSQVFYRSRVSQTRVVCISNITTHHNARP